MHVGQRDQCADFFEILAVSDTIDWSKVDEENRSGGWPAAYKALTTSRVGPGGDFVCFDTWSGLTLTRDEWEKAGMRDLAGIPEGFSCEDAWATDWIEDSCSSLDHATDLTVCQGESASWLFVPPLPLGVTVQPYSVFAQSRSIWQDVLARRGSADPVMAPTGSVANVADTLVTEPRIPKVVLLMKVPTWLMLLSLPGVGKTCFGVECTAAFGSPG